MINNYKIWDSRFLGKYDEMGNTFVNKNNELQYKIQILSNSPEDFPLDTKSVSGFGDELKKYGFTDSIDKSEEERKELLKEFVKDLYLIFSVKESSHSDPDIEKNYYNSFNIEIKITDKSDKLDKTFDSIPLMPSKSSELQSLIDKIANQEFVGKNDAISTEKNDYPPFIIIKELVSQSGAEKYYLLGHFNEILYREEYGVKFISDQPIRKLKLKDEDLKGHFIMQHDHLSDHFSMQPDVVFIETELVNELTQKLISGQLIEVASSSTVSPTKRIEDTDELDFLNDFIKVCKDKGLVYKPIDLYNFHTAIKTQSFVILAGMSGTGKSKLVQCYFEALNFQGKGKHLSPDVSNRMLFIPVRPFWQDDSDILGYLDTLNGIYRPGDSGLVDFILESGKEGNDKECYFVCLDEMNLARVEHYFSQFLSVLERDINNRVIQIYNSNLHGRVYNEHEYPPQLKIGENLFFVGTVNVDESTFQFSDKVLDRANVINLSLEKFKNIKTSLSEHKEEVNSKELDEINMNRTNRHTFSKFNGMKKESNSYALSELEMDFLWELHEMINNVNSNIGIGMRIVNQIELYLMNLPESEILTRKEALDLQVNQRILTKLRGSEGQLIKLVGTEGDGLDKGEMTELFDRYSDISGFIESRRKLSRISVELNEYGHTL